MSSFFATISGGIGDSLGLAIISSIFGVSGPIGMLIGGVIGVLVALSYKLLKSDKNSANKIIEDIHIPALLASLAIKEKKIIEARQELINIVCKKTKEELMKNIEQRIDEIIDGLEDELDLD